MEIKIDTSKDSKDEIKNIINFLQHFINEEHPHTTIMPEANADLFSMFSNDSEPEKIDSTEPDYQDSHESTNFTITPYE